MILVAAGLNLSWLIAAGRENQDSAVEPASPEARAGSTPPPVTPPAAGVPPLTPVDDFAAGESAAVETPVPGPAVKAAVPVLPAEQEWIIASPDAMPLATGSPFSTAEGAGLGGLADPNAQPVPASDAGSNPADLEQSDSDTDSRPPADDRTAPWVAAPGGFTGDSSAASGQWAASPSGFANAPPSFLPAGSSDGIIDGLRLSATLAGTYDTNPSQGYESPENSGQGDFFVTLGGGLTYLSKANEWTFGALYNGFYNQYVNQSELSGYNQVAGASVSYQGGPLQASLSLGLDIGSGANRYYSSVVDQISVNYRLSTRYKLSAKTSLTGDLSQSLTTASGGVSNDRSSFDFGVAALWRYSPLTEVGPGIRYTLESGSSELSRSSIGPTLTVNYKLSSKVSMNSRVGMEFAQYDDGRSADPSLSMSGVLNYQASRLWGMRLTLYRDNESDASTADSFTEVTSLQLGVFRQVRRATLNLALGYVTNTFEQPESSSAGEQPDQDYLTVSSSLSLPILSNSTLASLFLRYQDQNGGDQNSWNSTQLGFSLSRSF